MRSLPAVLLLAGLGVAAGCSRGIETDIPNNDSAALVEAFRQANSKPGHHTVRLARNGLYVLSTEAQAGLLLPGLDANITIEGNHAEIRGYSATPSALLEIGRDADVRIRNLVLAEGTDGTVRNYGHLQLENVDIVDGSVQTMPAIVLNHGRLELKDSEIAYNLVLATRRDSGTVLNYGQMHFSGSHIHGNRAIGRQDSIAVSGGILNFGTVNAVGLLIEDNELPNEEAPLLSFGGVLNLGNGQVSGTLPAEGVRDARRATVLAGL